MSNIKNIKILFVEDEIEICKNINEAIGDMFTLFDITYDGYAGLKLYKETSHDIIITDISMPKLNGLDMINKIRKISTSVPIIILSAFSEKEYLFKAIDMRVNRYLVKPIDVDELLNIINEISIDISKIQNIVLPMGYSYNSKDKKLYLDHKFISLTKKETLFMDILTKDKTDYVSNKNIYAYVWNDKVNDSTVRTFIRRLRQKTNKDLIVNISGLGYSIKT
jgi:DNA-binding response OmpR family regulator